METGKQAPDFMFVKGGLSLQKQQEQSWLLMSKKLTIFIFGLMILIFELERQKRLDCQAA